MPSPRLRRATPRLPGAHDLAVRLALGRTAIAVGALAVPTASVRLLGVDTATATRVAWLTRMMAIRDGAIGVGGLVAARRGSPAPWLIAGAVCDGVDAAVLASALRLNRVRGVAAKAAVPGAATAAVVGALVATATSRR